MDSQRQQASERIKQANNILVTVSSNPSVDQLAACIGLTVGLNKMGKHATAVFSGEVPSTLEFLQPEKTIEKNTDSLRDFIIALDKSKADKLRYKVEDRVVKIFITPYRTSISDKDLEFSQGDFNVDVVLALGVHNQNELDLAITSHGRILHDATIVTLNIRPGGELGSINWLDPNASSLSELAVQLVNVLDKNLIDSQIATAFLTGIVAETERFSNNKTTPQTMSISAQLMTSGANQQLVATRLQEPPTPPPAPAAPIATQKAQENPPQPVKKSSDGTLEITHDETKTAAEESAEEDRQEDIQRKRGKPAEEKIAAPAETVEEKQPELPPPPQIHIDEHGSLSPVEDTARSDEDVLPPVSHEEPLISHHNEPPKMVLQPPTLGGSLTASGNPGVYGPEAEGAGLPGMPQEEGGLPKSMAEDAPSVGPTIMPPPAEDEVNAPGTSFLGDQPLEESKSAPPDASAESGKTLTDIERDVHSSHLKQDQAQPDTAAPAASIPASEPPQPVGLTVTPPDQPPTPPPVEDPIVSAFSGSPPPASPILPPVPDGAPSTPPADTSVPDMPVPITPGNQAPAADASLDEARQAVERAMGADNTSDPIAALNAQQLGSTLHPEAAPPAPSPAVQPDLTLNNLGQPQLDTPPPVFGAAGQNLPPSAPPPMMPPAR